MKKIFYVIYIFEIFVIMLLLSGCTNNKELNIENKINAEIEFAKHGSIVLIKKFETNFYSDDEKIDWENAKDDGKVFTDSFVPIEEDFTYVGVNTEIIENIKESLTAINMGYENNDFDTLKIEYSNLFLKFENFDKSELKNFRTIVMNLYVKSIAKESQDISESINSLVNEYKNIKQTKQNYISLNRCNNIIIDIENKNTDKKYDEIRLDCINLIDLLENIN